MTYLLAPNGRAERQLLPADTHNQTQASLILLASSRGNVVLRCQENGHIILPDNNPPGKLIFSPRDTIIDIHGM
jgi:hypothetical protein